MSFMMPPYAAGPGGSPAPVDPDIQQPQSKLRAASWPGTGRVGPATAPVHFQTGVPLRSPQLTVPAYFHPTDSRQRDFYPIGPRLGPTYSVAKSAEPFVAVNPWRPKRRFSQSRRNFEVQTSADETPAQELAGVSPNASADSSSSSSTRSAARSSPPLSPDVGGARNARPEPALPESGEDYAGELAPVSMESGIHAAPTNTAQVPGTRPAFPGTAEAAGVDGVHEALDGPIDTNSARQSASFYSSDLPPPATPTKLARRFVLCVLDGLTGAAEQLYLHCLLRIPLLYLSRVSRIVDEADFGLPDIKRIARAWESEKDTNSTHARTLDLEAMPLPQSLLSFKATWEGFINALLREWKTLNLISVLLLSAILTLLQLDAAAHPIIRTTALFSLICAIMSLLYGCIYIIRFGTMRKMHKASSFASDAGSQDVGCWWNVWVLLAMPAIWLSWSIITFLASIMSFIWLSGSSLDGKEFVLSPRVALGTRIGLTLVFALGLVYFVLIVREFHRYGDPLDEAWERAVNQYASEPTMMSVPPYPYATTRPFAPSTYPSPWYAVRDPQTPIVVPPPAETYEPPAAFSKPPSESFAPQTQPILPVTLMRLGRKYDEPIFRLDSQATRDLREFQQEDLDRFMLDVSSAWQGELVLVPKTGDETVLNSAHTRVQLAPRPLSTIKEEGGINLSASSFPIPVSVAPGSNEPDRDDEVHAQSPTRVEFAGVDPGTSRSDKRSRARTVPARTASSDRLAQAQAVLDLWNARYFSLRHLEVVMERGGPPDVEAGESDWPATLEFIIVLRSRSPDEGPGATTEPEPAPAVPNTRDHTTLPISEGTSVSGSADVGRSLASGADDANEHV